MSSGMDWLNQSSGESYANKTLNSSIHVPGRSPEAPRMKNPNTSTHTMTPSKYEALKKAMPMDQIKTTPANPNAAHH
jgi:hypothetical protein